MKVNQADQFIPSAEKVQEILTEYGLMLSQFEPAMSGIENCTLIIVAMTQKYVMRVYRRRRKPDTHIAKELAFIKFLAAAGLKTVPAIPNQHGRDVTKYGHWRAILMPFQTGTHPPRYTPELISELAINQATMHQLAQSFKRSTLWELPLTKLKESQFSHQINPASITNPAIQQFLVRAQNFQVDLSWSLPRGYCHLDFDSGNILVNERNELSAILDFDDLATAPYVVCLAYTLWSISQQDDADLVRLYLNEYQSIRPLTNQELSILPAIILFRHYVIGSLKILNGSLDNKFFDRYVQREQHLAQQCYT